MNSRATRTPYILSAHTVDTGVIPIQDLKLTDVLSLLIIEHFPEEDVTLAWENQWRSRRSISGSFGEASVIPGPHTSLLKSQSCDTLKKPSLWQDCVSYCGTKGVTRRNEPSLYMELGWKALTTVPSLWANTFNVVSKFLRSAAKEANFCNRVSSLSATTTWFEEKVILMNLASNRWVFATSHVW